jgi:hypothetical protein
MLQKDFLSGIHVLIAEDNDDTGELVKRSKRADS